MATHCDDTDTLIVSCNAISKLGEHHPIMLMLVNDDQDGLPLHNAVMAALVLHIDNAEICQVACKAIVCIAEHSTTVQQVIVLMYHFSIMKPRVYFIWCKKSPSHSAFF